jgi:D-sedoheptulose 7-phosphate isomerase
MNPTLTPNEDSQEEWLKQYLAPYRELIESPAAIKAITEFRNIALEVRNRGGKMIFAGNGASAAIAGHLANDFTKQGGIRSVTFHDPTFFTAFSNDYGFEWWLAKALEFHMDSNDALILISSSGKSPNIIRAADYARSKNVPVITFTGFAEDNPLKSSGTVNFWVESRAYNHIECVHMIWLTAVVDLIIGKAEYLVS